MKKKIEIEKFNERNFGLWKMKMKVILNKENCLEAIGERRENVEDRKWEQMDEDVVSSLYLVVVDNILSNILKLQLRNFFWDTLTKLYETKSLHNKIFLKKRLYTL